MSSLIDDYLDEVRDVITYYSIQNIVESGTGPASSGLAIAERFGLRGYSCDVYGPCVESAKARHPRHVVQHGESLGFFRELFKTLDGPTFFWLDGHCPTDLDCLPGPDFPPFEEISLIKAFKKFYGDDVIWCDDMPMVDVPDNPIAVPWDVSLAGRRWTGAKEHAFSDYELILADSHTMEIVGSTVRYTPIP